MRSTEIVRRMHASHEAIRKESSKAYRVLLPCATPEQDTRTPAIVVCLRVVRDELGP